AIPEKEGTLQPNGGGFTPPSHEREPNCRDRRWQNAVYTGSDHPPAPTPENRMRRPTNKNAPGRRIGLGLLFSLGLVASAAGQGSEPQKTATFAGGCFWCVEADFDKVEGVISTTSGYTGGRTANPSYEEVSRGGTGHAEAVEIVYDPAKVSYEKLLDVFWHNIDPLAKDQQFCDRRPIPQRDLLSWRRAARAGGGLEGGGSKALQAADPDRYRGGRPV